MDILEYAMQMELDGEQFYKTQAADETDDKLMKILLSLAEEEQRHYAFFKKMRDGHYDEAVKEMDRSSQTLSEIRNIFKEMADGRQEKMFSGGEAEVWKEALRIEEKAEKFYREKAQAETDPEKKKLLDRIANEERNHIHMIDGVLHYLRSPDTFGDSQQYRNFMSWEGH